MSWLMSPSWQLKDIHFNPDWLCMSGIKVIESEYIALNWLQSSPWIPKFSNYNDPEWVCYQLYSFHCERSEMGVGGQNLRAYNWVCMSSFIVHKYGIVFLFIHHLKKNIEAFTAHEIMIRLWLQFKCNVLRNRE